MAYINYDKEDMKNESYQIIAGLLMEAINGLREKNPHYLLSNIDAIYVIIWNKIKNSDEIEQSIEKLKDSLYNHSDDDEENSCVRSECLDDGRKILKQLTKVIDEHGLLFGISADVSKIVAGG